MLACRLVVMEKAITFVHLYQSFQLPLIDSNQRKTGTTLTDVENMKYSLTYCYITSGCAIGSKRAKNSD